ncbi:hypothetical protein DL546_005634 [Coniochaeta pulveracea]|uniref:Tetraspanin Tsp3 n=1 Tax=Coniochaeta pulveracea TaxID=177199 RepID=A0A420YA44_9PEZI|nr:hypothetical protein DL546_005634 [Coniochaeta pulveracea]
MRAKYQHLNAVSLSLPLSSASTIAAILLPVLSFLNTLYYNFHSLSSTRAGSRDPVFLPQALQVLQTIFATVLATTFYSDISSDSAQRCLLSTRWQKLWSDHDSAAVRRIQDTWDCCGFNSIKDRAWPFPHKGSPQPDCATQWGRTIACGQPWGGAMRQSAGLEFGIVVVVSLLQLANVLLSRYFKRHRYQRGATSHADEGFIVTASRLLGIGVGGLDRDAPERRRLTGSDAIEDVNNPHCSPESSSPTSSNGHGFSERPRSRQGHDGYGAAGRDIVNTDSDV